VTATDAGLYHFFIAHASKDGYGAQVLYDALTARSARVFLDAVSVPLGSRWDERIPEALRTARVALVLISSSSDEAYFQQEEIQMAIQLSRSPTSSPVVVPIYVGEFDEKTIPYGLRRIQALQIDDINNFLKDPTYVEKLLQLVGLSVQSSTQVPNLVSVPSTVVTSDTKSKAWLNRLTKTFEKQRQRDHSQSFEPPADKVRSRLNSAISEIEGALAAHRTKEIAVIYADVDRFTSINKIFGPEAGNRVLERIEMLATATPQVLTARRLVNDQFAIVTLGTDVDGERIAREVLERTKNFRWDTVAPQLQITLSAGVVRKRFGEPVMEALIRAMHGSRMVKLSVGGSNVAFGTDFISKRASKDLFDYES
jgi:GGDEF domain-containing protein